MKKEEYWSKDAIAEQAGVMLSSVMPWRQNHPFGFDRQHCALLILDMQRFFLDQSSHAYIPSAPVIIPHLNNLQRIFLQNQLPVLQTQHTNNSGNAAMMGTWWRELITKEKPEAAIVDELLMPGVDRVEKHQYDAFFGTDLHEKLTSNDVKQLVIAGVMTHLCCETTARSAFMRGYEVFFLVDGTATYTRAFHQASLQAVAHGVGLPVLVQEIIKELE